MTDRPSMHQPHPNPVTSFHALRSQCFFHPSSWTSSLSERPWTMRSSKTKSNLLIWIFFYATIIILDVKNDEFHACHCFYASSFALVPSVRTKNKPRTQKYNPKITTHASNNEQCTKSSLSSSSPFIPEHHSVTTSKFRGPIVFPEENKLNVRISRYYEAKQMPIPTTHNVIDRERCPPTSMMLQTIVNHLAYRDAPIKIKEVVESVEFYLKIRKRLLSHAERVHHRDLGNEKIRYTVQVVDCCAGHGLTGILFAACNPPSAKRNIHTTLIDIKKPKTYNALMEIIAEICPWIMDDDHNSKYDHTQKNNHNTPYNTVSFLKISLEEFQKRRQQQMKDNNHGNNHVPIVIAAHACGSLTDQTIQLAMDINAAGLAVMPCCYRGTGAAAAYGIQRIFGRSWATDIYRSSLLTEQHQYHTDFVFLPQQITPMNRIIVGEKQM